MEKKLDEMRERALSVAVVGVADKHVLGGAVIARRPVTMLWPDEAIALVEAVSQMYNLLCDISTERNDSVVLAMAEYTRKEVGQMLRRKGE